MHIHNEMDAFGNKLLKVNVKTLPGQAIGAHSHIFMIPFQFRRIFFFNDSRSSILEDFFFLFFGYYLVSRKQNNNSICNRGLLAQ